MHAPKQAWARAHHLAGGVSMPCLLPQHAGLPAPCEQSPLVLIAPTAQLQTASPEAAALAASATATTSSGSKSGGKKKGGKGGGGGGKKKRR